MTLVCLLGRHGSGKSTIGADLVPHGFQHTSVGVLRRLAKASQFPVDVPAALMMAMRRERAGSPMSALTAQKLVDHAAASPKAVLDGFPSSVEHLALLPAHTVFCVVWTPAKLRLQRLKHRSDTTKRVWTPGLHSEREATLPVLLWTLRRTRRCIFVSNSSTPRDAVIKMLEKLGAT
ncbi:AAA family ATPase [Massilia aerilata]|uniref:AAA family ATPase n=1 Tax=Massilia aerilata TaxID=453817 RepID=A0ABW0S157_9BURK